MYEDCTNRLLTLFVAFQIVLLGDANVGKSSIVTRFITEQFDTEIKNTVGAAFVTKTVETDGQSVKFQIWDTAGQGSLKCFLTRVPPPAHTRTRQRLLPLQGDYVLVFSVVVSISAGFCCFHWCSCFWLLVLAYSDIH